MNSLEIKPTAHVVDILGNVVGRDQPIFRMEKALEMVALLGKDIFADENVAFFDPFCKAGELLLACAFHSCWAKSKGESKLLDVDMVIKEIYKSNRYFGLAPDERHHRLSIRTFLGNEYSHNEKFNHVIRDGHYLSEEDGTLDKEKFEREFNSMIEYINSKTKNKRIIAIGNPPYQETDGGGMGKSAVPVYNVFTEKLLDVADITEFVLVIPSRWFVGGKGLNKFRDRLMYSKQIKNIVNFSNSRNVFPTVDINGGVCFINIDKRNKYELLNFIENNIEVKIDITKSDIIPDDPMGLFLYEKIKNQWQKNWVSDVALSRNAFGISANGHCLLNGKSKGDISCYFLRKQVFQIKTNDVTKSQNLINKYKVVVSKAAGGSKKKRRATIPTSVIFILKPKEVCSETYSIIQSFNSLEEAKNFEAFLKTNFARYFVGLRKITQNLSRDSWKWVPLMDSDKIWSDEKLFKYFNFTTSEQEHIKKKIQEWS
ncbi:MAG: Eco57I restriction-modification methylase domain-containing protein [Bacteriovoracaceae bacterium]